MRGEKTIEFDFEFTYSRKGSFMKGSRITLREPGLGKRQVHATMTAFMSEAMLGQMRHLSAFQEASKAKELQKAADAEDEEAEDQDEAELETETERNVLATMAAGLGTEKFPAFMDYVIKALTEAPKLASIEDSEVGLTHATLEEIAENGGMEAIDRIVGVFASFFDDTARARRKKNGAG